MNFQSIYTSIHKHSLCTRNDSDDGVIARVNSSAMRFLSFIHIGLAYHQFISLRMDL